MSPASCLDSSDAGCKVSSGQRFRSVFGYERDCLEEEALKKAEQQPAVHFYRGADANGEVFIYDSAAPLPAVEGMERFLRAGALEGSEVKQVCSIPGFSLAAGWFKSGYKTPRHKHDVDCLYHVVKGNLKFGTTTLNAGDGVFVAADTPYSFTAGDDGVEVLEFRHQAVCGVTSVASNKDYWNRLVAHVTERLPAWSIEKRPA